MLSYFRFILENNFVFEKFPISPPPSQHRTNCFQTLDTDFFQIYPLFTLVIKKNKTRLDQFQGLCKVDLFSKIWLGFVV